MSEDEQRRAQRPEPEGIAAVPGVVRVAASAWWHATEWTLGTSARAGRRLLQVAASPETAGDLAQDVREAARGYARDLVGFADVEERLRNAAPESAVVKTVADAVSRMPSREKEGEGDGDGAAAQRRPEDDWAPLRERGAQILRRSRDVRYQENAHPAYKRMLDEIAPDEARILRLLLLKGPQPAVDVRTGGPLGLLNSRLIAPGFSMLGARAGCRYPERVPGYLNNLFRLGMIWFSRETLNDPVRYQVLEAQPEVLAAIKSVRMAKCIRRSIHLTPFGKDFCRVCLALEPEELVDLPEHTAPDEEAKATLPPAP
jgi:abortive infection alpha-like protein